MEIDELKNRWTQLDNRLKENISLNEGIILKMAKSKADKSLNYLLLGDIFSVITLIAIIPLVSFWLNKFFGELLFGDIVMTYGGIACIISIVFNSLRIRELKKIDVEKNIRDNIHHIVRYNIQLKREQSVMAFIVPILCLLLILLYIEINATFPLWVSFTCISGLVFVASYWSYRLLYRKNIDSILKSLNEIKELEDE